MKNILVLVHDDAGQEARLQAALDLTRAFDGHLHCLDVVSLPAVAGTGFGEAQAVLLEESSTREASNRASLEERLRGEGVAWSMEDVVGEISTCIKAAAGLADLIVMNRQLDDRTGPDMLSSVSRVVIETHKLVVAVGQECRGIDVTGTAVVAWDGSAPAMAALTASVPLLKKAKSVRIIEIIDSSQGSVNQAAAYLSRHDIHVEIDLIARFKDDPTGPAEIIPMLAKREGAAYCVMGAYGHSRMRERIFGGVTRQMLEANDLTLVLAH
jgi:nucleotide-binding universal stress UspA family protein